jgi:putative transposase
MEAGPQLVLMFDMLAFETLNIKAMHQLWGRKVGDLGFADFLLKAQWLAKKFRRDLVKIDQWKPTTKICCRCGNRQDIPLNVRVFECGACGTVEDRDLNAAINILEAGRRLWPEDASKTIARRQVSLFTAESHAL